MWHSVLLFILVSYSSSLCHATWFSLAVRHSFLKELAIAKTAKYIWTWIRSANSFTAINIINNSGTSVDLYVIRESNVPAIQINLCKPRAIHICHISYMWTKLFNTGKYMTSKWNKSKIERQNFSLEHPRNSLTTEKIECMQKTCLYCSFVVFPILTSLHAYQR